MSWERKKWRNKECRIRKKELRFFRKIKQDKTYWKNIGLKEGNIECVLCENRKEEDLAEKKKKKFRTIKMEAEVWIYKYRKEEKDQHLYMQAYHEEEWWQYFMRLLQGTEERRVTQEKGQRYYFSRTK